MDAKKILSMIFEKNKKIANSNSLSFIEIEKENKEFDQEFERMQNRNKTT